MKKRYAILLSAVLALAFSCAKEQGTDVVKQKMTFRVNAEETLGPAAVKAALDASRNVVFAIGDQISVFDGVGNNPFEATSAGSAVEFSGSATAAEVYNVLSPYDAEATIAGNVITATIPKVQTAVLNGADPRALVAVARTTDQGEISLKNVVGLLKVTVPNNNQVKEIQVAAGPNCDVAIAGTIDITTPATASDVPTYTLNASAEKVTCVSLVPEVGEEYLAAGTYYIGVLNKTYEGGLTVAYLTNEESKDLLRAKTGTSDAVVERSKVLNLGSLVAGAGQYVKYTGNAILPAGPDVLLIWKKMADPTVTAFHTDDNTITRIEVVTNTLDGGAGTNSHTGASAHPIHAVLRDGVLTLYTRAVNVQMPGGSTGATNMFRSLKKLQTIDFSHVVIGSCTILKRMFRECTALEEADLSSLVTENVTNMCEMFFACAGIKRVNLSGLGATKVAGNTTEDGFYRMFNGCVKIEKMYFGNNFLPADGVKVNDMFYDVARLRDDTSIQAKIYCSDATWTWLTTGLVEGVHPTTGFNIYRFAHITE